MVTILTRQQILALRLIATTDLTKQFYFSGGTVLSHYYLQHRFSEDLDFFSTQEFDPQIITSTLRHLKILKLEFTYYPFPQIEQPKLIDGLFIDSPVDIATNKLFTIAQKPRGRDYYDLYHLIDQYNYQLEDLRMQAKLKFDWHIDPLQLASRFHEINQHLDDPIITKKTNTVRLVKFFQDQALNFQSEITSP